MFKKFIKSEKMYIVFGNLAGAGFGLFGFLFLTRTLSKVEFGAWMLFVSLQVFGAMLRNGIVQTALVQYYNREPENRKQVIGTSWILSILTNIAITLLLLVIYIIFKDVLIANDLHYLFIFYPIFIWTGLPFNLVTWITHAKSEFKKMAYYIIAFPILIFISYAIGWYLQLDLMYIFAVHIVARLLLSAISFIKLQNYVHYIKYYDKPMAKKLFRFGQFSLSNSIGSHLLRVSNTFFIGIFLGTIQVAAWSVANKLNQVIDNPVRSVTLTLLPQMTQLHKNGKYEDINRILYKFIGLFAFLTIPVGVAVFFLAPFIIHILSNDMYPEAVLLLQILTLFMITIPFNKLLGVAINAINKPEYNTIKLVIVNIFNLVLLIPVILIYESLYPIAFVLVITNVLGVFITVYYLKKELNFKIRKVFTVGMIETFQLVKLKLQTYAK